MSHARNVGLQAAKGAYITFCDADDYVTERYLEDFIDHTGEGVDMVVCGYKAVTENGTYIRTDNNRNNTLLTRAEALAYVLRYDKFQGYLVNTLFKAEIIQKHSLVLNESVSICEDLLFKYLYISKCTSIAYLKHKNYVYVQNSNSAMQTADTSKLKTIFDVYTLLIKYELQTQNCIKNIKRLYTLIVRQIFNMQMRQSITEPYDRKTFVSHFKSVEFLKLPLKYKMIYFLVCLLPQAAYRIMAHRYTR